MKNLLSAVVVVLAVNMLLVAGGLGFLAKSGKLTRESITKVKEVLFAATTTAPATQPAMAVIDPTTQPLLSLQQLLAKKSGQSPEEQVSFLQQSFDAQQSILDRRQRELLDQQATLTRGQQQLVTDREEIQRQKQDLSDKQVAAQKLADDKGFQDSLALYSTMPGKQVKTIFMTLDDATVQQYLQAMEPRTSTKVVKEFKSPEEIARIQKVLERMRQTAPPPPPVNTNAAASAGDGP